MPELVSEGLNLALYGMGTVFVFLTVLVGVTHLMSWLVLRLSPQASAEQSAGIDASKLAAITAAVHQHRQRQ